MLVFGVYIYTCFGHFSHDVVCYLMTGSYDGSSSPATQSDTGPKAASYKSIQASHGDMDPKIPNNTSVRTILYGVCTVCNLQSFSLKSYGSLTVLQILVNNLVPNVTEEQLRQFFTPCGKVNYVQIMAGTRFGFVQFVNRYEVYS